MALHSSTFAWKIPWMEEPGKLQSKGSIESDTTERLHFHFSLSCMGEGNGNPLQCSCLENPRDGAAWWAAVHRVAQSRTWLKRLSNRLSWFLSHPHLTQRVTRSHCFCTVTLSNRLCSPPSQSLCGWVPLISYLDPNSPHTALMPSTLSCWGGRNFSPLIQMLWLVQELNGHEANRRKSHRSWITCMYVRDPGKLSNSLKWPKLSP